MITADQVYEASDLLVDREELANTLAEMRSAKVARVSYQMATETYAKEDGTPHLYFRDGPELSVTPAIRKLLTGDIEARIAEIDAKLVAIGVEPPVGDPS
jgi:hypothetical protein